MSPAHLSLAGQLVALCPWNRRSRDNVSTTKVDAPNSEQKDIDIDASLTTDDDMRQTAFGNLAMQVMGLYSRRIEQTKIVEPRKSELLRRVRWSDMVPVREVGKKPNALGCRSSSGDYSYPDKRD